MCPLGHRETFTARVTTFQAGVLPEGHFERGVTTTQPVARLGSKTATRCPSLQDDSVEPRGSSCVEISPGGGLPVTEQSGLDKPCAAQ